jgi:Flp pilus assembly protein TadG
MRNRRHQQGATIVEAALIMLLFFTLVFSVVELGRVLNVYHTITNAAREGARYSVAPFPGIAGTLPTSANVRAQVCTFLTSASLPCTGITVNQSLVQTVNGISTTFTQVNVSTPYNWLILPLSPLTLTTQAVMRNETN